MSKELFPTLYYICNLFFKFTKYIQNLLNINLKYCLKYCLKMDFVIKKVKIRE